MRLYSYVVARDYGFAPNPFGGTCTLCCCKPNIRRVANIGDWVIGTGSAERQRSGRLVYAMTVTEAMSFDQYWQNPRFALKKPNLKGSKKQAFGDNIYSRPAGVEGWQQMDSHHSLPDGRPNAANIVNDTRVNRVLISQDFVYFGGQGPTIPALFRDFDGTDICARRNHKSVFPEGMIQQFIAWIRGLNEAGYCGEPLDWSRTA